MCFKLQLFVIFLWTMIIMHHGCLPLATKQCLDVFMSLPLMQLRGGRLGLLHNAITGIYEEIRIVNSVQFTCPTQIGSIMLGIQFWRPDDSIKTTVPSLQLWRPASAGSGYVKLVPDSERLIEYTPANFSSGIHEYPLVPPLNVSTGDYLAISQPSTSITNSVVYKASGGWGSSYKLNIGEKTADLGKVMLQNELVLVYPITAQPQHCVKSSVDISIMKMLSLLFSEAIPVGDSFSLESLTQYFYPDMKFTCNGTIHKWIYSGVSTSYPLGTLLPELQVWRQTSKGNYNKQGSSKISANGTMISHNVYELGVDPPIEFMEGDILGLHQPQQDKSAFVLLQSANGPDNFQVEDFIFDVAPDAIDKGTLILDKYNNYPLVSVITDKPTSPISSSSVAVLFNTATGTPSTSLHHSESLSKTLTISSSRDLFTSSTATTDMMSNKSYNDCMSSTTGTNDDPPAAAVGASVSTVVGPAVAGVVVIMIILTVTLVVINIGIWKIIILKQKKTDSHSVNHRVEIDVSYDNEAQNRYIESSALRVLAGDNEAHGGKTNEEDMHAQHL